MSKVRNFSEIAPNIAFPEFNFYELYYSTFEKSELGRIKKLLPLREMAENFGLVRKSMRPKLGRKSFFTPEGKVAMMFLKMYTGLSCPKLMEQLNGNIHYQIFCDVIIDPTRPLTNYKLLDDIMMERVNRIVSLSKPHLRPIVRGKEVKSVEFGAKVNNILVDGISFIEKLSFNAFNEGTRLVHCLKMHKKLFGGDAKKVGGDTGHAGTENRDYCKADGNPVHLLRHPHGKRGSAGGQDRTKGAFGGCLTLRLAVNAVLLWGNFILAMKNKQKIRPKRPETDIELKF